MTNMPSRESPIIRHKQATHLDHVIECKTKGKLVYSSYGKRKSMISYFVPTVFAKEVVEVKAQRESEKQRPTSEEATISECSTDPEIKILHNAVKEYIAKETGMDRIRNMYAIGDNQEFSQEFMLCAGTAQVTGGISFLLWYILGSLEAREKFLRENLHTKFLTRFRAARSYHDVVTLGGIKSGVKWMFKFGAFVSIFMFTSQTIAVYRNKSSVLEYSAAGAVTGSVFRLNLGLRGSVAAGIIGSFMGTVSGGLLLLAMKYNGDCQEDRHYRLVAFMLQRKKNLQSLTTIEKIEPTSVLTKQTDQVETS